MGHAEKGFSLLELVVALAIVAISLALLFEVFADGTGRLAQGEDLVEAAILAEGKLAEFDATGGLGRAEDSGVAPGGLAWRVSVEPYGEPFGGTAAPAGPDAPSVVAVTVAISWQDGRRTRDYTLHTLRLRDAR